MLETQSNSHLSSTTAHSVHPFTIADMYSIRIRLIEIHENKAIAIEYYISIYIRYGMKQKWMAAGIASERA